MSQRTEYLDQLVALLPGREARRARRDVEGMILDRIDALQDANPELTAEQAEVQALEALGPADKLAEELLAAPLVISLATRRAFVRTLWVVFAGHLVLSIVLRAAGSEGAAIPGLLAPLPLNPVAATVLAVLAILLIDLGAVFLLFAFLHFRRTPTMIGAPDPVPRWTKRDAIAGLVMLGLLAVIVNVFATRIFSVTSHGTSTTFLSEALVNWLPYLNVSFGLFALRMLFVLWGRPFQAILFDVLGCVAAVAWMVVAATRTELVQLSADQLGANTANVLGSLFTRVFLLVLIVGALGLTMRAIRMLLRLPAARALRA